MLLLAHGSYTCVCTCSLGAVRQKEVVLRGYAVYDAPAVCGTIQFCYRCSGTASAPPGWLHCREAVNCYTTGVPACCCVTLHAKEMVSRASPAPSELLLLPQLMLRTQAHHWCHQTSPVGEGLASATTYVCT